MTGSAIRSRMANNTVFTNYEYGQTCTETNQIISLYFNGNELLD